MRAGVGPSRRLRLGVIGLGSIGGALVEAAARLPAEVDIAAALVAGSNRPRPSVAWPCVTSLAEFLSAQPSVVVECAGQAALLEFGPAVLRAGHDLVPASVGLFADEDVLRLFGEAAMAGGSRVRLASGAVAGVDGLIGARRLGLDSVRYRFVMSPAAWAHPISPDAGAPGRSPAETVVYRGNARDAARKYPRHANVTATISLAGVGFERTEVEIVVDASATDNRHEIEAHGFFGSMSVAVTGRRISEASPSSRLVAGSLLSSALAGSPSLV